MSLSEPTTTTLTAGRATARVASRGAELVSWQVDGREQLWDGGGDWPIHAPILFPVICRVPDDQLTVNGLSHPMVEHGFGRHRNFVLVHASGDAATFALEDDAETRATYPYAFRLTVEHRIDERGVTSTFTVANRGEVTLPFELGHHPAYRWPLGGDDRAGHTVVFDRDETAPSWRLAEGLLDPVERPAVGRGVELTDGLFAESAVILADVRSKHVEYRAPDGRALRITWDGFTGVTLWSPVTDDFVCVETWCGRPALAEQVDFAARADIARVDPGEEVALTYRVEVVDPGRVSAFADR